MTAIPENIRRQATHFSELEPPIGWDRIKGEYCWIFLHPMPYAQVITPTDTFVAADLDAAIVEARRTVAAHGRDLLIWLVNSDHPWLDEALVARGLRHEDTPGYESIENAMALITAPNGTSGDDVEVLLTTTFEQFEAGTRVEMEAFGADAESRAEIEETMEARWHDVQASRDRIIGWHARLDGVIVGTANALVGAAGLNLLGGAVHPDARGRGVYRALVLARWEEAVRRGTPALTVQAGRMSGPVLARLGFEQIDAMRVYVDRFDAGDV